MASLAEWLKTLTPEQNQFVARLVASLPESEGGLGLPLQNTAMQRADILFPDEMYHGTGQENLEFLSPEGKNRTAGAGAFLTTNPINAETYVPGLGQSGNILPLRVNRKGLMEVNAKGRNWNDINTNDLFYKRKALVDIFPEDLSPNDVTTTDEIAQLAPYAGFEGVTIKNVRDQGPNSHVFRVKEYLQNKYGIKPTEEHTYWDQVSGKQLQEARDYVEKMYSSQKGDVTAIQNPARIRSKFAGFNPWRTNESNLLASHPLATALGSATLAKMLGAGQNIDLRQSINDKLSKSADPLGLYSRYGMEAPYSYGDVAQQAIGATDLYAPIAAGEAIEAAKKGEWKKSGLSALGALPIIGALKASHGSPHAFTKFDFSKIGTGDGAQAYGHGGYFAQGFDSPVAKEYRDALAGVEVGGKVMAPDWDSPYYYPLQALRKHGDDIEKARADVYERNKNIPGGWPEELVAFEDAVKQGIKRNQGHLYNVELKWPDPAREAADPLGEHHLLDWDAPMSQQPSYIKKKLGLLDAPSQERMDEAISNMMAKAEKLYGDKYAWTDLPEARLWERRMGREIGRGQPDVSGAEFYRGSDTDFLHGATAPENERSQYLRSLGIPGIRYLDQGSRAAGTGSRNYVMFDDALANIVSRNGVSLSDLLRR